MGLFAAFETSEDAELNGVEMPFDEATNKDGTVPTFIVATAGVAYLKAYERLKKPFRREIQNNTLSEAKMRQILAEACAETLVKGWKNVKDADEIDIPFSRENAVKLLVALPIILNRITDHARDYQNYRKEALEAEAKN